MIVPVHKANQSGASIAWMPSQRYRNLICQAQTNHRLFLHEVHPHGQP